MKGIRKKLPQRRFNIIDVSINSYCVHLKSPACMDLVQQTNDLAAFLTDMEMIGRKLGTHQRRGKSIGGKNGFGRQRWLSRKQTRKEGRLLRSMQD